MFIFSFALPIILVLDTIRVLVQTKRAIRESTRITEGSVPSPMQNATTADEANLSAIAESNSAKAIQSESLWTTFTRILVDFWKTSGTVNI